MKKLIFIFLGTITMQALQAQAPINTPDNIGSGNCLDFDGMSNYVEIPSSSELEPNNSVSVEAWFNSNSLPGGAWSIITAITENSPGAGKPYSLQGLSGEIHFGIVTGGNTFLVSTPVNNNRWYHAAGTYDGNEIRLYIDGVLMATRNITGNIDYGWSDYVAIGRKNDDDGEFFDGQIDEVRIWGTARTQAEIRDNMCKTLVGNEVGLVAYWNMNEGQDNSCSAAEDVCDLTGNGNHGTLH